MREDTDEVNRDGWQRSFRRRFSLPAALRAAAIRLSRPRLQTRRSVTADAGAYLALSFSTGFTKENTVITVDGADVTKYATPVTDDGSVVKLPLVAQPGSVTLTSGNKTQTTDLGTKADGAVYTGDHLLMCDKEVIEVDRILSGT